MLKASFGIKELVICIYTSTFAIGHSLKLFQLIRHSKMFLCFDLDRIFSSTIDSRLSYQTTKDIKCVFTWRTTSNGLFRVSMGNPAERIVVILPDSYTRWEEIRLQRCVLEVRRTGSGTFRAHWCWTNCLIDVCSFIRNKKRQKLERTPVQSMPF